MKIEIAQKQLESLLTTTYKAISNKPIQPILGCFLVQADAKNRKVTVTAYNGKLSITAQVDCQVYAGGTLALNARLLSDIVSSINGTLGLEATDKQVVITHTTGKCRIASLEASEFPELFQVQGESITLPTQTLKEAFGATLFAAAKDEVKQILAGIHLQITGSNWECAATDGHRLGVSSSSDEIESFDRAVTIPQATIACLKEILSNTTENCQITISNNAISFNLHHICLTSLLLEGSYPLYKSLIPKQFDYYFNINKNSLKLALERVAIVTSSKDKIVQITFTGEQATLYAESADVGDVLETVSVSSTDKTTNITFGFNAKYFLEALRAIPTTDVLIEAIAPTYPVILSPIGVGKVGKQIALIMPVQLKEIKEFTTEPKPIVDKTEAVLV